MHGIEHGMFHGRLARGMDRVGAGVADTAGVLAGGLRLRGGGILRAGIARPRRRGVARTVRGRQEFAGLQRAQRRGRTDRITPHALTSASASRTCWANPAPKRTPWPGAGCRAGRHGARTAGACNGWLSSRARWTRMPASELIASAIDTDWRATLSWPRPRWLRIDSAIDEDGLKAALTVASILRWRAAGWAGPVAGTLGRSRAACRRERGAIAAPRAWAGSPTS